MKHRLRTTAAVAALAASAIALSACSGGGAAPQSSAGSSQIVIDKSFDLVSADPARMFETTGTMVLHAVYDSLVTFDPAAADKPKPSLATKWSANDDATAYTFTLRDGVTFSDGTPLTSADVVFSLNRVKNIKGNGSFLMDGLTVTAPDEKTVVISSEKPNTAIPAIMTAPTLGIVNKKAVTAEGGTDAADAAETDKAEKALDAASAGTGPYILKKWDTTTEVILEANPKYWGTKPAHSRVVLRNATADAQLMDVQSGTADVALDLGSDQTEGLKGNSAVAISTSSSPTMFFMFANANPSVSATTSSPDFREAVRYGIDQSALLELAGKGAVSANGIIPNSFLGALGKDAAIKRDVARAKAAVARLNGAPTVELEYPSDISSNGLNFGPFAERIAAQLKEVGITVTLKPTPVTTALASYRAGTEQMGLWLWNPDYSDSADYLAFGPGGVVGLRAGWAAGSSPDIEAIMAKVAVESDPAKAAPLYEQYQKLSNEHGVIVPLFQPAATVVSSSKLGKVDYSPAFSLDIAAIGR